ncbi:hypothetical protein SynMEDNS5_00212 [Synechococcus sp. MEDNS5]|nr:hypothetical protein SynMEDNS5_00212 [Synechococcus sp. MEDNS5]
MKSYLFSSSQNFLLSFANFQSQLILAEYPKSGGSFFSNVLSDVYQSIYHFPRPIDPLTFRPSLLSSSFSNVFD